MQASAVEDAQRDDDAFSIADLISAYEKGVEELRVAVAGMTVEQLRSRPVAGKWSTLEVICHIADCEQFFADRMKRTVAMDRPLLLGADGFLATDGPHAPIGRPRCLATHRCPQRNRSGDATATAAARHQPPAPSPSIRGREAGGNDEFLKASCCL